MDWKDYAWGFVGIVIIAMTAIGWLFILDVMFEWDPFKLFGWR